LRGYIVAEGQFAQVVAVEGDDDAVEKSAQRDAAGAWYDVRLLVAPCG